MRFTPNLHPLSHRVPVRAVVATGIGAAVLLTTGCSSSDSAAQSGSAASSTQADSTQAQRSAPGTSGLIAEIDGKTFQVQGSDEQTAVTYSSSTRFTSQVTGKTSDIKAGECVSVRSATNGSASPGATETGPITASSITISAASGGSCQEAAGGGGQQPAGSAAGQPAGAGAPGGGGMPSGGAMPSGARPSGAAGSGGRAAGGMLSGKVTAVSGSTITVAVIQRSGGPQGSSSTPSAGVTSASGTTAPTTVTVAASTSITRTETTTASALKVGLCAVAQGSTDSTGAVTATSVRLSRASNGSCTTEGRG
ncbi:DUF5666 domain-containing protein [Acidipropionibacterium jensenii]|uniref:DUF5666 domain-containing protein n=1 Tax=Acidipropionibacterium jensenii TaxID=1749 RepID=UPI00214BB5D2|nr:DUF5666 domain-containing protein [Acidipropionibacterium jensenii]